jgi:hypothetical protein
MMEEIFSRQCQWKGKLENASDWENRNVHWSLFPGLELASQWHAAVLDMYRYPLIF